MLKFTVSNACQKYLMKGLLMVNSTVANQESLIIMIKGIFLEQLADSDNRHWLKSYPYSVQKVPDAYSASQFSVL